MQVNYISKLHNSVIRFKKKANRVRPRWSELTDNGEWELDLYEFIEMRSAVLEVIEKTSPEEATDQMIDDVLFGIARDNECCSIVCELLKYPEWYSLLCKKIIRNGLFKCKMAVCRELKRL